MPKGPKGEKRPADVIGAAITVAKIAKGEIEDSPSACATLESLPLRRQAGEKKHDPCEAGRLVLLRGVRQLQQTHHVSGSAVS
jgi:hypothetical protein